MSNEIIKVEYGKNEFMEFEIKPSLISENEGLGGISILQDIALSAYEKSIEKMTSFLKSIAGKVKDNLKDLENDGITVSLGFSLSAEGNFVVSPGAEASFVVEVSLKR